MLNDDERQGIADNGLFRGIGLEAIGHLLDTCRRRTLAVGETLLQPDKPNGFLYVVLAGELRVYLGSRDLPEHTVLRSGDCAGEMSLIDGQTASAQVIASLDSVVLEIPHDTVWSMIDCSHGLARNLLAILAGRMRNDNLALVSSQSRTLEFEQAASVDALTGLHNRRWMDESFPRAIQRCEVDASPLCLVMADIDCFKDVNDRHGHLVGDTVLRMIARELIEGLRPQDLLARYGGEEFAILLPETEIGEGVRIAERLRATIATTPVAVAPGGLTVSITLSCGIAPFRLGDTLETLLGLADAALIEAKQGGRDRIVLNPERA